MKGRIAIYLTIGLTVLLLLSSLKPPRLSDADRSDFDLKTFGKLPVLEGGRLKPIDSVARNSLLFFRGKQRALDADGKPVPPLQWLADVLFDRHAASHYRIFRVDNPDLLGLLGSSGEEVVHLSYSFLRRHLTEIDRQARLVPDEAAIRNNFHKAILRLRGALIQYQHLETALVPHRFGPSGAVEDYARYESVLPRAGEIMRSMQAAGGEDTDAINDFVRLTNLFRQVADSRVFFAIPHGDEKGQHWREAEWMTPGSALLERVHGGGSDPAVLAYARIADAWMERDATAFNQSVAELRTELRQRVSGSGFRTRFEYIFNFTAPFYLSLQLYVLAFLAICFSWLGGSERLTRVAFWVVCLALIPHTIGIGARVYLSGYAPVTNLYSSAVFVGWGAVLFAVPLERMYRNGLAMAAATLTGICSLIVAHNLALSGGSDTMEMMRAVLDSNFWLATHVITVVIGYSATFLAGALGMFYMLRGVLTRSLDEASGLSIERMVYGTTCFALLFCFIGTVLGGVWADQSWGRFWGWDPKENGALMIVLWTAMMLHAKRIKMVGRIGFMQLAIGGGIVTAWSWFGTNLLGIGLHSYGFMERGFFWLMVFWISQLGFIAIGWIPALRRS